MPNASDSTKLYVCVCVCVCVYNLFTWAYRNCQHHYSCTLGPILSKIRLTWTPALRNTETDDPRTQMAVKWLTNSRVAYTVWILWTRGWFTSWVEWKGTVSDFYHVTQSNTQYTIYKLFISEIFHLIFSGHSGLRVTETMEGKTADKEELLCTLLLF